MTKEDRSYFEDLNRRLTLASCKAMRLAHGHPSLAQQETLEAETQAAIADAVALARARWGARAEGGAK